VLSTVVDLDRSPMLVQDNQPAVSGIKSWRWRNYLHLSRLALGPTQFPVQWVLGLFSQGESSWAWHWSPPIQGWDSRKNRAIPLFSLLAFMACCRMNFNPLNPELNPICYLLALLRDHHFLHVSRIRVKSLTFRRLMSYIYIYGAPILDVSRSHTMTQHSR